MINAEVTARAGTSDVTGVVRGFAGKQSGDGEKSGFSDTLSSLGSGSRKQDDNTGEGETTLAADAGEVIEDVAPPKGRSALDLTARVLLGKTAVAETATPRVSISGKDVTAETKAEKKIAVVEDTVAGKAEQKRSAVSAAAGTSKTVKEAAAENTGAKTEDTKQAAGTAETPKETGVDAVMSLLSGATLPEAAAVNVPRQSGQVRDRSEARAEKSAVSATEGRGTQTSAAAKASDALAMPGAGETASVDERTFRISSARGAGQSMDMKIGADDQGVVSLEAKNAAGGNAESVVVLDSRRFLGFGQSTNGAALTAAISGDKGWAAAMSESAGLGDATSTSATGNVVNTLKLQMNPHDLGSVTATLRLSGDTLNVHLTVETHAAYRQLNDDSTGMLDALRSQGFAVDQVTISVASSSQSDSTGQQQSGQQQSAGQSGQQAAGHDGRQGNGAGREQNQTSAQSMAGEGARGKNDAVSDSAVAGSVRPDQLYL